MPSKLKVRIWQRPIMDGPLSRGLALSKNFQEVLIKIYYDAGLCELAIASGHQPNSIGSNFKRTHNFLLEVWESVYRHFLSTFLRTDAPAYFQEYVSNWIKSFPESKDQDSTLRNLKEMLSDLSDKYKDFQEDFTTFLCEESSKDKTKSFGVSLCFKIAMRMCVSMWQYGVAAGTLEWVL